MSLLRLLGLVALRCPLLYPALKQSDIVFRQRWLHIRHCRFLFALDVQEETAFFWFSWDDYIAMVAAGHNLLIAAGMMPIRARTAQCLAELEKPGPWKSRPRSAKMKVAMTQPMGR